MPYIGRTLGQGTRSRFLYTATAGQTTFSGSDSQSNTLAYADNNGLDCFQNGVLLKGGGADYTATTGTSVVLTTGASVNDVIEILVYDVFAIADHVKKSGDAMTGALTNIDVNGTELILDSDGDTSITSDTDDQVDIKVGGSDIAHVTSTGLGIGTSSPSEELHLASSLPTIRLEDTDNNYYSHVYSQNGDLILSSDQGNANSGSAMRFEVDATEKMRLDSTGLIVNGTSSGGGAITAYNVANAYAPPIVELNNVATDFSAAMFELRVSSGSINTTNGRFIHCYSDNGSTTKMKVLGDGDIENVNNNYTGISDLKLKENIADSNSQWDDLKNLKVKKFSFKADKKDKADKIGVIAQDLEASNMSGLVRESKDFDSEGNDLGTTTKSVKYSILYMKAVKALQEAMARIETLEAKVTALESK